MFGTLYVFFAMAFPYLLGTYLAVQLGADNPSTVRTVAGWLFEALYIVGPIVGAIVWFVATKDKRAFAAEARAQKAQELAEARALEEQELAESGTVYAIRHGSSSAYRHGFCTINHRNPETASRCRNG
ncbi:hypothetical protein OG921_16045 [Aldersonia sp. NBC_00410]|uniref:hypothetical protein n=1 Tax=Aldersonia sp. NBC_00410 TaxID=2975954 RepID=UPI002251A98B|nr:hypothetical protein [Aldersonia sp. NBC_00410]MCX5044679.1 hypothetical protein [Aldersonia sp. NBC_00410]